ncbi:type VI secretion system membrane subunit TssM [Pseudoxanthomonas sp.]|uniref:type VI secretion system membrane subunit TssM n=1 Tax=Pseudoxanthomonas sp. TaxID=1871049 RepID=UPI0026128DA7|nr:type VI secretion system membrane subunit TssM [Pseudoxanthomonas sp.]WDS37803.1 MAG: type VI secretion system membrane subunit TssM [Pseudoxanthomonas sp.]
MATRVLALFKSPWVLSFIGVLLLSALAWWLGPWIAVGGRQPLASVAARIVVVIVLLLGWVLAWQWAQLRASRHAQRLVEGAAAGEQADERNAAERTQLEGRFAEAMRLLRKRGGGKRLQALPWYVVIGPPGSGKTTLLQNSGLNFPLAGRMGSGGVRGVGGTRNCDWWFADEAVFLDTAGRYTLQDSDQKADAGAWADFLRLLRRYRRRRPLNGVLVTMSLSDLLVLDDAQRDAHVQAVRGRVDELAEQLGVRLPVYLVFTKCDLVGGFDAFFDDLNPEQRAQVWGASFPLERTLDGSAARAFADEFAVLLDRLNARMLARLHGERDQRRRAQILAFPQQVASLGEVARQFVEGVFGGHAYGAPPLLRGVYLTSGTQEGTPIDRMMGAVARTFGLAPAQVQLPGAATRTFFVQRLLHGVVLPEAGLAGVDPRTERRHHLVWVSGCAAAVVLALVLVGAMVNSYLRNRDYLAQVHAALDARPAAADPSNAGNASQYFAMALQQLEGTSSVLDVARQHQEHVPLSMRWGLYQGGGVSEALDDAYARQLNALLVPGLATRLRQGLRAHAGDPQALYYTLKGYLMLAEPAHADPAQLETLGAIEWRTLFADDRVLQQALARHFQALLEPHMRLRAISPDPELVEQARASLRSADLSTLVYSAIRLEQGNAGTLRLDKAMGLLGDVFTRSGGTPISTPVPALYTQPVFAELSRSGIGQAVDRFVKDGWVLGQRDLDVTARAHLVEEVQAAYEKDYVAWWDALLAEIKLRAPADVADASAIAARLAGPSSPLRLLLKVVRQNTQALLPPPSDGKDAKDPASALKDQVAAHSNAALARAMGVDQGGPAQAQLEPGQAVAEHFAPLNALTEGGDGAMPLDAVLSILDQLSKVLLTMGDFSAVASQPSPAVLLARQQAQSLPPPVSGWIGALAGDSAALVATGTRQAMGDQAKQAVGDVCGEFTRGRYPFTDSSGAIPLQNFAELFGANGRFDQLRQQMQPMIDASGSNWSWKQGPGVVAAGPAGLPAQLQLAQRIGQEYFRGGAAPDVSFSLQAPLLSGQVARLKVEIDGQTYEYAAGGAPSMPMRWPGPVPGRVVISAFDASGAPVGQPLQFQGDWALFRALDAGRLQRQSDLGFTASYEFSGSRVQLPLQAGSLRNPFGNGSVRRFKCAS